MNKAKKDLNVFYNGELQFLIDKKLLDKQSVWDNLEIIKKLHILRLDAEQLMKNTNDVIELQKLDQKYTELEFELQQVWGFAKDVRYHKFWNRPKCICPKMDNEDRCGMGYNIRSSDCPLHGSVKST